MSLELGLGEGHVRTRSLLENVKFRVELGEGQEQVCTRKCGVVSLSLGRVKSGPGLESVKEQVYIRKCGVWSLRVRSLLESVEFGA